MTFWLRFGLIAAAVISCFLAGHKVARLSCQAEKAEALRAAVEARKVDESFANGVSAAYEGVASQLRRITAVNQREIIRETQKVEYRCPLPVDALGMLNDGIAAANTAATQSDATVPVAGGAEGKGSGGTGDRLFGTDGDVR